MGAPNINIIFVNGARSVASLSARGTVALLVRDTVETGGHTLRDAKQIPSGLTQENQDYIARVFTGYVEKPGRVLVYVLNSGEEEDLKTGLAWLGGDGGAAGGYGLLKSSLVKGYDVHVTLAENEPFRFYRFVLCKIQRKERPALFIKRRLPRV